MAVGTLTGLRNRLLQLLALYVPGAYTTRVWLHRRRGVTIGQRVFIGTAAIIETERPDCVTIGNDVTIGIRAVLLAHHRERRGLVIGDEVFVGPGVIVQPGVKIGRGAVVTAGSVVTRSVGERIMVQGNPARPVARCEQPLTDGISLSEFQRHLRSLKTTSEST